jgi:hypothetical protein
MDIRRMDLTKAAVLGPIVVGTDGLARVNDLFEPLVGHPIRIPAHPRCPT